MTHAHRSLLLALVVGTTLVGRAAQAQGPQPLRLISTGPSHRVWLTDDQVLDLARLNHVQGHCGGYMDVTDEDVALKGHSADIFVDRPLQHADDVARVLPLLSGARITDTVTQLSSYQNRYYQSTTGKAAAEWIAGLFTTLAAGRRDVTVELVKHRFAQPSVIARILGSGANKAEKIVLGAHEDSINWQHNRPSVHDLAPGADDNASGVAVLLETFRALMQADVHPDRTLEFMAYAGEELGLLGSQDIAQAYRKQKAHVVAVLQMDMTMYPSHTRKITLITDNTNRTLNRFTENLIDAYVGVPWQESRCGYGCSDHASWDKVGYPAVFPFESTLDDSNPAVHTANDTLDAGLDSEYGLAFAKLTTAFALELGL